MTTRPLRLRLLRFSRAVALALPLTVVAAAAVAHAASAPCAASVEEARRHMDKGLAFFDRKHFPEAAAEFDAAYQAQPFSAFLCNAAVAYSEALDFPAAISRYKAFLAAEPNPPDLVRIKTMLAWLEAQQAARLAAHGPDADAGTTPAPAASTPASADDAGLADAGSAEGDAGAPSSAPITAADMTRAMRSQVVVESDPPGAPLRVWSRGAGAPPFLVAGDNPGWTTVASGVKTPYDISLAAGDYHIVLEAFQDYKRSETGLSLAPGRVYGFKANLSQGAFLGHLRVSSPVEGARIFVDDPPPHAKGPWGRTPHGDLLASGEHRVWVEAPGFTPFSHTVALEHGKTAEITAVLERVAYGIMIIDGNAEEVTVKVDGVPYSAYSVIGEPLRLRLPSGPHRVELDASGRKAFAGTVEVPRGQEIAVHARLSFSPPRLNALISGTLCVGAAVGGGVLLVQPQTRSSGVDPQGRSIVVAADTQPWFRIGGFVSLGVSGLLLAATIYTLVNDPNPPSLLRVDKPAEFDAAAKKTGLRVQTVGPLIGAGEGGAQIRGVF